jgi:hypothetical protein
MLAALVAVFQVHVGARSSIATAAHWAAACVTCVVTLVAVVLVLSVSATVVLLPGVPDPLDAELVRNILPVEAAGAIAFNAYPPTTTLLGPCVVNAMDGFAPVPLAEVLLPIAATPTYVATAQATLMFDEKSTIMLPEADGETGAVQISTFTFAPAARVVCRV